MNLKQLGEGERCGAEAGGFPGAGEWGERGRQRVRSPGVSAAGSEPSSRHSEARAERVLERLAGAGLELA